MYMPAILFSGADRTLSDLLRYSCGREGLVVHHIQGGRELIHLVRTQRPRLVILDLANTGLAGLNLLVRIRAISNVPVLVVDGPVSDEQVSIGFEHGADDYVTRPFNLQVLICRIKAVLRRSERNATPAGQPTPLYDLRGVVFNAEAHELIGKDGRRIRLTRTENKILLLLARHDRTVLSAEQIREAISMRPSQTDLQAIKTHIYHLRSKLAQLLPHRAIIEAVPGAGYTIKLDDANTVASALAMAQ